LLALTAAFALALPARAFVQDAPEAPPSHPTAMDSLIYEVSLQGWSRGFGKHAGNEFLAAKRESDPLQKARVAFVTRRDWPPMARDADHLLEDAIPHLSMAEVACLQGWFGRDPKLEARYTQAALDAGRKAEARAQALKTLASNTDDKDLLNLLKKIGNVSTVDTPPGATQSVFHVDLFIPVTGDYEAYGRSLRAGLEIAVVENNERTRTPIHLTVHETQGEGWRAAREGKHALDEGAGILVGDVLTVPTLVLAGLANQTGVPLLSPSATDPKVGATGPLVFQTGAPVEAQARALAGYAVQTDRRQTIAAPADLDTAFLNPFESEAKQLGAKVVRVSVSRGMRDFKPVSIELARTRADAVLLPLDPEQAELWVSGLSKVGIFLPFLATDAADPQGFRPETRRILEGMTAVSSDYALPPRTFARVDSLAHAAYDLSADRFVRRGYLTGRLIGETIAGGADSPSSFAAALRKRAGPLGFIHYEEAEASLPILSVRRGQLVRVH
jgi:branched-chain amino acid transport system substrate-binding protein